MKRLVNVQLPNGEVVDLPPKTKFFNFPRNFEINSPISDTTFCPNPITILSNLQVNAEASDESGYVVPFVWVFEHGKPQKVQVDIDGLKCKNPCYCEARIVLNNAPLDKFYRTAEDAIMWNDYTVVNEDGSETVKRSRAKALILSEEQKVLVEAIKDAVKAAKDAGVRFVWDSDDCVPTPVNTSGLKVSEEENGCCEDDIFVSCSAIYNTNEHLTIHDYWSNCDYGLSVEFNN